MKFNGGSLRRRSNKFPGFTFEDDQKMGVEEHEFTENLMIESAIHESGLPIVRGRSKRAKRFTDLTSF